jgi:hypothetical protein
MLYATVDTSGGPIDLTISEVSTAYLARDLAVTLVYTDLSGDTTDPSVAITIPSDAVSVTVSTYMIAGTASDETELDYVQWTCEESDESGVLTVTNGSWGSIIPLAEGANTIVVEACDTSNNCATDSVVITQIYPTFSAGGSFSN